MMNVIELTPRADPRRDKLTILADQLRDEAMRDPGRDSDARLRLLADQISRTIPGAV